MRVVLQIIYDPSDVSVGCRSERVFNMELQ
jgi:hypothetical protein